MKKFHSTHKKDTVFYRLRRAFVNPFSIVLLTLAVISFFTDVIFPSDFSRNFTTTVIILSMLLVSGIVRFVQEMSTKRITDRLVGLVHTTVRVFRNGGWKECSSEELRMGERVYLEAGDRVPADIQLDKTNDFFVSESPITGESGILEKEAALAGTNASVAFMGSNVVGGSAEGIVKAVGENTLYGKIRPEESERKHGFDRGENSIAWVLIKFMAVLTPIVFAASGLTKGNWLEAFLFALSVAVGLTPELLPMVISACMARGSYLMGKKQTIVKTINAMQGFGSMDTLCVDKTGTLTGDQVQLEYYTDVFGDTSEQTLTCAYLNSYYHSGIANHLDTAILRAKELSGEKERLSKSIGQHEKLDELPFDYSRKFASVLFAGERENFLVVKGDVPNVAKHCSFLLHRGEKIPIGEQERNCIQSVTSDMMEDGMKVLAVAVKKTDRTVLSPKDEESLCLLGYLAFFDAPKKSAASAIQKLHSQHIRVKVLTGDHADVAISICRRLGVDTSTVITGTKLEDISDDDLPAMAEHCEVFAELAPKQKARIVKTLQDEGHSVGFLGDGMNDLPAVTQADVGISVDTGTESVKEIADVILLKKDLNVLSEGVLEGRKAFANMSKYVKITASSNFGNILAIVIASVLLPFFPMTAIQLLLLNLLYDILCLVLPWDNVDAELVAHPLEWSGRTLGRFMLFFGPISSAFDFLTFAFLYFFLCPMMAGGGFGTLDALGQMTFVSLFQTGWFLESMWTQVLILQLLRTKQLPFVQSRPSRPMIVVTVVGIFLFTVFPLTSLGSLFGMMPLPALYYVFLIVVVCLYLLSVTLLKKFYIHRYGELI